MFLTNFKLLASIAGAGCVWIADIAAAGADYIPDWTRDYGLPGAFLILTIYAVRTLFAANQQMQRDALAAKDAQILTARQQSDLFLATTKELITATNHQTGQLEKFTERLAIIDTRIANCGGNQANQFPFNREPKPTA